MKCPVCPDSTLLMSDRQGVEIDHCPHCRGVWLDRGELDKLVERSVYAAPARSAGDHHERQPRFVDSDHAHGRSRSPARRKSWLSDFFD